jgi:hypothetical protein
MRSLKIEPVVVRLAHNGHASLPTKKQKRAVHSKWLPVSRRNGSVSYSEPIASGLPGSNTRHDGVPSGELPRLHVRGAEVPSGPVPTHTRVHPSGETRRSIHAAGLGVGRGAPRSPSGGRPSPRLQPLAKRRCQRQAPARSLIKVYAFDASCFDSCKCGASLKSVHGWRATIDALQLRLSVEWDGLVGSIASLLIRRDSKTHLKFLFADAGIWRGFWPAGAWVRGGSR